MTKQNKIIYIYIYMTKQQRNIREKQVIFKRIIHDYNYSNESKDSEPANYIYIYIHTNSDVKISKMPKIYI